MTPVQLGDLPGKAGKKKGRTTGPAFSHVAHLRTKCSNNTATLPRKPSWSSHQFWW